MSDPDKVTEDALRLLKEEVKARVRLFALTPFGRVVETAAREVIQAQKEGRTLDETDLAELCLKVTTILRGKSNG